jgi:hypothetical protein
MAIGHSLFGCCSTTWSAISLGAYASRRRAALSAHLFAERCRQIRGSTLAVRRCGIGLRIVPTASDPGSRIDMSDAGADRHMQRTVHIVRAGFASIISLPAHVPLP